MAKRRENGEGCIYRRSNNGRWVGQYTVDGKKKSVYGKTQQEAKEKLKVGIREAKAPLTAKNLKQLDPVTVDGVPYEAYELQDIPAEEWNAMAECEHSTGLAPVEFNSQRILTTRQLADSYDTTT